MLRRQRQRDAMGRAKGVIRARVEADWPRSWLDAPMTALPGTGPWGCPDIEQLLDRLKARVLAAIDAAEMK